MARRKSSLNAPSAPKGSRLAAFAAHVEAVASGQIAERDAALAGALNKRNVVKCSQLWKTFAQQVANANERQTPASRVLLPAQQLPPLP